MILLNAERFTNFIKKNVKFEEIDVDSYETFLIQSAKEGKSSYELGSYETKSGHAETIDFDYESDYDEETDEMSNERITF